MISVHPHKGPSGRRFKSLLRLGTAPGLSFFLWFFYSLIPKLPSVTSSNGIITWFTCLFSLFVLLSTHLTWWPSFLLFTLFMFWHFDTQFYIPQALHCAQIPNSPWEGIQVGPQSWNYQSKRGKCHSASSQCLLVFLTKPSPFSEIVHRLGVSSLCPSSGLCDVKGHYPPPSPYNQMKKEISRNPPRFESQPFHLSVLWNFVSLPPLQ